MNASLYLFPIDARTPAPPTALVRQALHDLALIGEPLNQAAFAVGPQFTRHIVFAGCSPQLVYTASRPDDLNFCHLAILGPYKKVRLITGPLTRRPRCPKCGERAAAWQELESAWQAGGEGARAACTACGRESLILAWRWQRQAVFGRLLLAVRGVFPSEAVPSEALLDALSRTTGRAWDYGWAATVRR